jgi:hypothetical protein
MKRPSPADRFALQYERGADDECWNWKNSKSELGYGRFFFEGKSRIASRMAYIFACGPIPDELCVLHSCDNPSCVNPSHLRLGTLAENTADILKRGRWQAPPKVSPQMREKIKERINSNIFHREIAREFGISRGHVTNLARQFRGATK